MRVNSSGLARGLANARPPQLPGGGGWAQVELTDALTEVTCKKHYT